MTVRIFLFSTLLLLVTWPGSVAWAQHGHGHGAHIGHGHGGHSHWGHAGHAHWGHVSHGHIDFHLGHHYVLPHFDHHYHGSYWVDSGVYYYRPRTYVSYSAPATYAVSSPVRIEFGGFKQSQDLVGRLGLLANELCLDLHYNYSHNPGYAETYREAYRILNISKSLQTYERGGNQVEIVRQIQELDPLFHSIQDRLISWNRVHQRQIGQAGLQTKLQIMETLLHHLAYDVGIEPHGMNTTESAPAPLEEAPLPGEAAPMPMVPATTSPPTALP